MIVDYNYYVNTYEGEIFPEFTKLNRRAESKVNYLTFGRLSMFETYNNKIQDSIRLAICELIEFNYNLLKKDQEIDRDNRRVASETVGKHTVSYKYDDEITKTKTMNEDEKTAKEYELVAFYLMDTGLMYRGS